MTQLTQGATARLRAVPFMIAALLLAVFPACRTQPTAIDAPPQPVVTEPAKQARDPELAQKQPAKTFFLSPGDVDVNAVLPKPFDVGSPMAKAEADLLLGIRAEATEAAMKRMEAEEKMTLFTFSEVLGEGFTPAKYPKTAIFFKRIDNDAYVVAIAPAKELYNRPRPPFQDDRVKALLPHSQSNSYPSGHATTSLIWSRILSELAPAKKDELRARARLVALDRVIGGVHYPTDVTGGIALGDAIADALMKNEKFKSELEMIRKTEWSAQP
jgi:acid phosphatase (class A)